MKYKNKRNRSSYRQVEDGDTNWLISYADLMTLLWGFFVILSAYSVPSKNLIEKLKESTVKSMGGEYKQPYKELSNEFVSILKEMKLEKVANVQALSDGLKLTLNSGNFFASGSTEPSLEAQDLLIKVAAILKRQSGKFKIFVEGHTDDVPMKSSFFASNWELSSSRASTVVRLFEREGVDHSSLRPIGLSDVDPLVSIKDLRDSDLIEARSQNRRIIIRMQENTISRLKNVEINELN